MPTSATAQAAPASCEIKLYPGDGAHSVGEDFDAVHKVDQDLADYYRAAGRNLNWLSVDRQLALLGKIDFAATTGLSAGQINPQTTVLTRRSAAAPGPRGPLGDGCVLEVMVPQIFLERGGLSNRSLRVFGVVRQYNHGQLVHGFTGFASAMMSSFSLRSPAEAGSATELVELTYVAAVEKLLRAFATNAGLNTPSKKVSR